MKKPTPKMLEVLHLMAEGWELGFYSGFKGNWTIQKGGLGKGGEANYLHSAIGWGLFDRKLIIPDDPRFPVAHYHMTPAGRKALETT